MKPTLCIAALLWAGACSFDGSGLDPLDGGIVPGDGNPGLADARIDAPPGTPDAPTARPDAAPADSDDDGVLDGLDNCPADSNTDQHDEDLDGVGDACDNCPTIGNPGQDDDEEVEAAEEADGVGDACDPRPSEPGDSILFFDSFKGPLDSDWTVGNGGDDWSISNDALQVTSSSGGAHLLYWDGPPMNRTVVDTTATVTDLASNSTHGLGVISGYIDSGGEESVGSGYACYQFTADDNGAIPGGLENDLMVMRMDTNALNPVQTTGTTSTLAEMVPYRYTFFNDAIATQPVQDCDLAIEGAPPETYTAVAADGMYAGGDPGLRTFGLTARFDHFIVYQVGPGN